MLMPPREKDAVAFDLDRAKVHIAPRLLNRRLGWRHELIVEVPDVRHAMPRDVERAFARFAISIAAFHDVPQFRRHLDGMFSGRPVHSARWASPASIRSSARRYASVRHTPDRWRGEPGRGGRGPPLQCSRWSPSADAGRGRFLIRSTRPATDARRSPTSAPAIPIGEPDFAPRSASYALVTGKPPATLAMALGLPSLNADDAPVDVQVSGLRFFLA